MAIALKKRRVVTVNLEPTRGTFVAQTAADAIPTIREPTTFAITPKVVDRSTYRLSLTKYPNTYPGVATCEIVTVVELGGLPTNPKLDYDVPLWADLFRACGFEEVSNAASGAKPRLLYGVSGLTGTDVAGTPIRHGQAVTGNGSSNAGAGIVIGDFYSEDDILCVQETTAPTGTPFPGTGSTWTQTIGGLTRVATGTHDTVANTPDSVVAFRLRSDVNAMETVSMQEWLDGKLLQVKGCAGNAEIQLDHGDMIRAQFTMSGVVRTPTSTGYSDVTAAAFGTPNEAHKVAPTFLGEEVRFFEISSGTPLYYGKNDAAAVVGSISTIRVNTGNQVILRGNAFDPAGVNFAIITSRAPSMTFNPDEVLNSEFPWVHKFVNGTPIRFKAMVGTPGSNTTLGTGAFAGTAQDGNTIDVLAPGIVIDRLGDTDRDGINTWDGSALLTGGDYDTSASGEAPGNDNELTIIHR